MLASNLASAAATIGLLVLFPMPGALFGLCGRNPRSLAAWIDAIALGYATSILALYLAGLQNYLLFVPVWTGATAAAAVGCWRRWPVHDDSAEPGEEPYVARRLLALMVAAFALRMAPALYREFPLGWDPYFHLVVAAKIQHTRSLIVDLQPIEAFPLNYPQGSHVLLALLSDLGGVPLHHVFSIAMAWFETLCVAQLFCFTCRLTKDRELALYATAGYGLLAILGSLGYYIWGGLPNLIGIYLFLGLLSLLAAASNAGVRQTLIFALFFLAICVVHHHAMVAVAAALIPLAAYQFAFPGDRGAARLILRGGIASGVLGVGYFLPYLRRVTTLPTTGILNFDEGMSSLNRDLNDLGLAFSFTAIMGVLCAICLRRRRPVSEILVLPLSALLVYYVALKYGARAILLLTTGRHISLFTPSRFLTDAVPLLAIFAAGFLCEMRRLLGTSADRVIVAIALCFVLSLPFYGQLFREEIPAPYQAAYSWLRDHSDGSAGVLENRIHGTYMTGRVASGMPLPISEYNPESSNKERLRAVLERRLPASDFAQLYAIEEQAEFNALPGPVVWKDPSGLHIRRLH